MKAVPHSIEGVAREFHRIRSQTQGRPRFPKELWQAAFSLSGSHTVAEIASALGISSQYFRKRLDQSREDAQGFAQIRALHNESHSFVEITLKQQAGPLTLRWTGPIKDLPTLIGKLFRGEFS